MGSKQKMESQRRTRRFRDPVHSKRGSSHSSPKCEEWAAGQELVSWGDRKKTNRCDGTLEKRWRREYHSQDLEEPPVASQNWRKPRKR